jgi:hypothetical protein
VCQEIEQQDSADAYVKVRFCATVGTAGPTISHLDCESIGQSVFCDTAHAGGVSPIGIAWRCNNSLVSAFNNLTSVSGTCTGTSTVNVKVTVTDANGRSVDRTTSFACGGNL